jgi:hypothetical protein
MEKEQNYINMYGSMSHCWKIHRRKMQQAHKPWVTYATFRYRVKNLHWSLYKAINTPAVVSKRDKDRRMKVKLHIILYRIKKFFFKKLVD